jgi:ribosomal protein S12 methylthiotransferase accessory factor
VSPKETIRRVLPLCHAIGVTRVADVTGLDRIGIPNYTTVRPREAGGGLSYYNGKGITRTAAKAGALMEALERHTGELCDLPVHVGTLAEMQRRGPTLDPRTIVEPTFRRFDPEMMLEWVQGLDVLGDQPMFVPLNGVVCPYRPSGGAVQMYYGHTNGLASGNTIEEALCHAICEVVERDALAMADTVARLASAVMALYMDTKLGAELTYDPLTAAPVGGLVALDTLPPRARALVEMMEAVDLLVYLRDVTSTIGIAAFDCVCIERRLDGRHLVHVGSGSHPDARVAVNRAITEAAQSRVAHIQGGREDLTHIAREPAPFDPETVFGGGGQVRSFDTIPSIENEHVDDDIRFMLDHLSRGGFQHVIAVDLTRPELGVPVIRVVVPQAESWSTFFNHGVRARLGARANRLLAEEICNLMTD